MKKDSEAAAVEAGTRALDYLYSVVEQLRMDVDAEAKRADDAEELLRRAHLEIARLKETAFAEIVREVATERMGV